jgi:two-component system, OmpR family, response regulator
VIRASSILVVDDDDDIRTLVCLALEWEGYRSIPARDGLDALTILREWPAPALILLDLMMPRMDGEDLLAAMRASPGLERIPVIIMSGHDKAREKAETLLGRECLVKPVDLDVLLHAVQQFARPGQSS